MTWAKGRHLTDWTTKALPIFFFFFLKQRFLFLTNYKSRGVTAWQTFCKSLLRSALGSEKRQSRSPDEFSLTQPGLGQGLGRPPTWHQKYNKGLWVSLHPPKRHPPVPGNGPLFGNRVSAVSKLGRGYTRVGVGPASSGWCAYKRGIWTQT